MYADRFIFMYLLAYKELGLIMAFFKNCFCCPTPLPYSSLLSYMFLSTPLSLSCHM